VLVGRPVFSWRCRWQSKELSAELSPRYRVCRPRLLHPVFCPRWTNTLLPDEQISQLLSFLEAERLVLQLLPGCLLSVGPSASIIQQVVPLQSDPPPSPTWISSVLLLLTWLLDPQTHHKIVWWRHSEVFQPVIDSWHTRSGVLQHLSQLSLHFFPRRMSRPHEPGAITSTYSALTLLQQDQRYSTHLKFWWI